MAGSAGARADQAGNSGAGGDLQQGNAGASDAAGAPNSDVIPDFNGCTMNDYVDGRATGASRTITFGTTGLTFTPKCLTVAVGQTVEWAGSFSTHPLAAGNPAHPDAGSPNSPIEPTSSGSSMSFTFASAGTFPYYCQVHSFGDGMGMAGVVHVTP